MEALKCPHCGNELGNGVTVCGECGKEIEGKEINNDQEQPAAPETKQSGKKIYAILAVFLVVVGGAALLLISGVIHSPFRDKTVAAVVNGEKISQAEVNQKFEIYKKIFGQTSKMDFSTPQGQTALTDMKRQVLHAMIQEKILLTEAVKEKIAVSQQEIQDKIAAIKKTMNLSDQDFDAFLKNHGMNQADLAKKVEKEALIGKLLAKADEQGITKEVWLKGINDRAKVEITTK